MTQIIVLKTQAQNLREVVRSGKHALPVRLKQARAGDIILIAESPPPAGSPQIRYGMRYRRMYEDSEGESRRRWNKQWRYIVEGDQCRELETPFSLSKVQISSKNYGQGGTIVYLAQQDVAELTKRSLLRPLL
jgi:hypothetical protein